MQAVLKLSIRNGRKGGKGAVYSLSKGTQKRINPF